MMQELETKLKVRKSALGDISRKREVEFINVFEKVNGFRKERAHMVSTFANYKFLLSSLAYYARNKSTFDTILATSDEVKERGETAEKLSRRSKSDYENDEVSASSYNENDDAADGFFPE